MSCLIPDFPLGRAQKMSPFDAHEDIATQTCLFLYLTGRGQYSYLFADTPGLLAVNEAERTIPMGYTQLWVLSWTTSIQPMYRKKSKPSQRRAVQTVARNRTLEGRSYVLIGENGMHFGSTEKLHTAVAAARLLAVEKRIRIVIALLKANVTWH